MLFRKKQKLTGPEKIIETVFSALGDGLAVPVVVYRIDRSKTNCGLRIFEAEPLTFFDPSFQLQERSFASPIQAGDVLQSEPDLSGRVLKLKVIRVLQVLQDREKTSRYGTLESGEVLVVRLVSNDKA
jgi:hypothetical protein